MIYSDYNNDKFTEHDALSTALYLSYLPQIQRVFANVESLCTEGANVKAKHTHTHTERHTHLDLKMVGSGFMVSCYSIILLSRALVRAALGRVR